MTLKEAMDKMRTQLDMYWDNYKGWSEEHPEMRADRYFEGKADGIEEALSILEEVEDEI